MRRRHNNAQSYSRGKYSFNKRWKTRTVLRLESFESSEILIKWFGFTLMRKSNNWQYARFAASLKNLKQVFLWQKAYKTLEQYADFVLKMKWLKYR